jgi:hypothetical protein
MYPDEATLIARGKYSTLSKERRKQLERAREICTSITTASHAALRDCEHQPPEENGPVLTVEKCLANLKDTRERLTALSKEMIELQPIAWPEQ